MQYDQDRTACLRAHAREPHRRPLRHDGTFTGMRDNRAIRRFEALRAAQPRRRRSLVDVGGGSGGLAIAMAEAWPNLTITIADLPAITPVAQRYADEAGFAARIKVYPTNVVSDPLSGSYDAAVMRGLFPVLTPDQIRSALAHVYSALKPGSPIYVVGWILDNSRITPLSYATYNLLFVNDYADGLIHTEAEHRIWLEETGFEYILREPSAPSYAADFILARKPPS
jgi:3-hydroxy-5-methyl-1-naphthoate 3-O-methyltransferase